MLGIVTKEVSPIEKTFPVQEERLRSAEKNYRKPRNDSNRLAKQFDLWKAVCELDAAERALEEARIPF